MSWNGFVKAVNRATTSVNFLFSIFLFFLFLLSKFLFLLTEQMMQYSGALDKTVDRNFEEQEKKFVQFEQKIEKLHKEAKGYLDSVRSRTMALPLRHFYCYTNICIYIIFFTAKLNFNESNLYRHHISTETHS